VLVRIEGRILHRSRSAIHAEVEFRDVDDALLAKGSAIQVVSRSS
jgi:acyl-coenzyme A thioesterase PaaI-like protein